MCELCSQHSAFFVPFFSKYYGKLIHVQINTLSKEGG